MEADIDPKVLSGLTDVQTQLPWFSTTPLISTDGGAVAMDGRDPETGLSFRIQATRRTPRSKREKPIYDWDLLTLRLSWERPQPDDLYAILKTNHCLYPPEIPTGMSVCEVLSTSLVPFPAIRTMLKQLHEGAVESLVFENICCLPPYGERTWAAAFDHAHSRYLLTVYQPSLGEIQQRALALRETFDANRETFEPDKYEIELQTWVNMSVAEKEAWLESFAEAPEWNLYLHCGPKPNILLYKHRGREIVRFLQAWIYEHLFVSFVERDDVKYTEEEIEMYAEMEFDDVEEGEEEEEEEEQHQVDKDGDVAMNFY